MEKEFTSLVKKNEGIILKVCHIYCQEASDREDLYQDILVQLWRSFPSFDHRSKVTTWMYRIAFNTAVSRFRKHKRIPISQPVSEQQMSPDNSENQEAIQLLYKAIEGLSKIEKAITLLYLDGLKYKEMGEVLGLSESNVGYKLNAIKKKLKVKLKQSGL